MTPQPKDRLPGARVLPTLTEVVQPPAWEPPGGAPAPGETVAPAVAPPAPTARSPDPAVAPIPEHLSRPVPRADQLAILGQRVTMQVLLDVQRRTDVMLERRLREVLDPALRRLSDALIAELRLELARGVREMVQKAVADELARIRASE